MKTIPAREGGKDADGGTVMDRKEWLKSAVFYEIYPTSFFDANGDGVSDVEGINRKLDYIAGLGCNGIRLNPLI